MGKYTFKEETRQDTKYVIASVNGLEVGRMPVTQDSLDSMRNDVERYQGYVYFLTEALKPKLPTTPGSVVKSSSGYIYVRLVSSPIRNYCWKGTTSFGEFIDAKDSDLDRWGWTLLHDEGAA